MFGWSRSDGMGNPQRVSRRRRLEVERLAERRLFAANVLANVDFSQGTEAFVVYSNTAAAGVVQDPSGNEVFEDLFTRDETQTLLFKEFGEVDSVEVSFDVRFPDGIPVSQIPRKFGSVKLSRLNPPDGIPRFHSMQNELQFLLENGKISYELSFYVEQADFADRIRIDDPKEWTSIRYQAIRNTLGQADGIWKVWVNNALVLQRSDVRFVDNSDYFFTSAWVGGNISFGGDDPARPFRRQLDNVRYAVNLDDTDNRPEQPEQPEQEQPDAAPQQTGVVTANGQRVLVVVGNDQRDEILVHADVGGQVRVTHAGTQSLFTNVDSIEVYGNSGDDLIYASAQIPISIHGGDGNDILYALATQAFVHAGAGDDTLIGHGGSQFIVAGTGSDTVISIATTEPHIIFTGELSTFSQTSAADPRTPPAVFSDEAVDRVFSLGDFAPLVYADLLDTTRRWRWTWRNAKA